MDTQWKKSNLLKMGYINEYYINVRRRLMHVSGNLILFGRMLGINMDHSNMFQADREFVRGMLGAC